MWGTADPADLRATWADELAGFEASDIRDALDVMRTSYIDFPPTLYQFAALCKDAHARRLKNVKRLLPPRTPMPADIKAKIDALVKAKTVA